MEISPVLVPYILGFFLYNGMFSNFPLYLQLTQHLTDEQTVEIWAIISGAALLIGALSRVPAGLISDSLGRIPTFLMAYLVYFVSLVLVLSFSSDMIYIVAMAAIRFGTNLVAMTGRGSIISSRRDKGLKNGMLQSMAGLGSFLGPLSLGYILDHYAPRMIVYASIGFVVVDLGLFSLLYFSVQGWSKKSDHEPDIRFEAIGIPKKINYFSILREPGVLEIQLLFLATGLAMGSLQAIYSIYGYNVLSLSTTVIGIIMGVGALAGTLISPITGRLHLFIKDEYLRTASWAVMLIATVGIAFSRSVHLFYYIGFFVMNAGLSSYYTIEITRLSGLVSNEKFSFAFGFASSLVIGASAFAGFISPLMYGIIPEMNFMAAAVVAAVALLFTAINSIRQLQFRESDN